jgi:hypothetical protein
MTVVIVVSLGNSPAVFGLESETAPTQPAQKTDYGYVNRNSILFLCNKVDDTTSHIYLSSVFVNTSAEQIMTATITVEFIDWDEYVPYSADYTPVAAFDVVVKNIKAGEQKKFSVMTDISVENAEDNIDDMWNYYPVSDNRVKLGVFLYKIQYELSENHPAIDEIKTEYSFI